MEEKEEEEEEEEVEKEEEEEEAEEEEEEKEKEHRKGGVWRRGSMYRCELHPMSKAYHTQPPAPLIKDQQATASPVRLLATMELFPTSNAHNGVMFTLSFQLDGI